MTNSVLSESLGSPGKVTELLRRRDPQAINDLMRWYRPLLVALADRNLDRSIRSRVDASDLVQETCGDVASSMPKVESANRIQFFSYLRTSLMNRIQDARRRFIVAEKRSVYRETQLSGTQLSLDELLALAEKQPLDQLIHDETCQRVIEALGKLPRELQRVLRWRFRKGMTYREIGQKVGRTEDDVRMLIHRCLARVRKEVVSDVHSA